MMSGSPDRVPHPPPAGPLATVAAGRGGVAIVAVNVAARAGGVCPGLPLADARALLPALAVVEADPAADWRALETLADWCGRYTPWTSVDAAATDADANGDADPFGGGGGIWLDISGCAHLFGGEAALLDDLLDRLTRFGVAARAAVADTPGTAWAVPASRLLPPHPARRRSPPPGRRPPTHATTVSYTHLTLPTIYSV